MATFVSSLEHKSNVELKNLKDKLKNQLNKDIFRIYSESIFTDIYFSVGNNLVKLHRCFLQTRSPAFYHIFTHNPDLINIVPQQKLDLFFREIYCDTQIKTIEEDLLKCINTSFLTNSTSLLAASSDLELSNYYSVNDLRTSDEPNKSHQLDLPKLNTNVGYNYFRRSDNSVYYSLVDESLVLSDYSDINEEALKEMNSRRECDDLIHIEPQDQDEVKRPTSFNIEETDIEDHAGETLTSTAVVEHMNLNLSTESNLVNDAKKEKKSKFFSVESSRTVATKKGESFKFFIDASDLIDSDEAKDDKSSKPPGSVKMRSDDSRHPDSLKLVRKSNFESQCSKDSGENMFNRWCDKQTPDSLDDIPDTNNESSTQVEQKEGTHEFELQAKLQKDFHNASIADNCRVMEENPCVLKCINVTGEIPNLVECERIDLNDSKTSTNVNYPTEPLQLLEEGIAMESRRSMEENAAAVKCSPSKAEKIQFKVCDEDFKNFTSSVEKGAHENINPFTAECLAVTSSVEERVASTQDSVDELAVISHDFVRFKKFLTEKYDCAIKNHAYSDDERERLKKFDKLICHDKSFEYLKRNLEEIINKRLTTKTEVAMHTFLVKQYEKSHGAEVTGAFVKTLMHDILSKRTADEDGRSNDVDANNDDVDELLRKLLLHIPKNTAPVKMSPRKRDEAVQPVAGKSCGFFIDLKEKAKPPNEALHKSLPSKQLFSMFIDFGNSTDSDSSMEVQNKFERRKKQYISKLEKSRELRTSVTSLNEDSESRKLEKMTQNTPPPTSSHSVAKKVVADPPVTVSNETLSVVTRRCRNGSPHPHELRRSWNVDKTNEINRNVITKHKRSYSVTSHKDIPLETVTCPENIPHMNGEGEGNEFPSIGNADSTNELTANGESETSNCRSYSEKEERKIVSDSSHSNSNGAICDQNQNHPTEIHQNVEEKKVFVKLSDMDKEPKTVLPNNDQWSSIRMTKSATGTETNWFETKLLNGSVNSRSLSRIFPDLSANVLSKPNSDLDDTTVSSISSIHSSSAVSTCESNLEMSNNTNKNDNNTLGQDLLRMFLDEISTDVVVEVAGRRIKAHKCILTSRCQYFAALLSGGWVESAGNVLSIQGFSYNVVHFALCYIYSGESEIPESINIVELATLADYLCLEGLKEVVSCTLKMKYCHFFHKPCNICSVGVLECLPIAVNYGLDDIHRKSLRWITKHYVRLWCSKAFATLPRELIDKCYNQHVVNMTVNNVFETLINCDKLFSFIPQTRWAEPCFVVTKKLHDYCVRFLANHFLEFLKSEAFTSIASTRTWGIMIMDEKTQLACAKMRSDQLCQGYAYLNSQCKLATASHESEELIELLNRVKNQVESALLKTALQASQCNAWFQMEPELRSHIQNAAGLTFLPSELKRRVDSFKSRQPTPVSSGSRDADLQQVKSVINRQHKQNNIRSHEPRPAKQNCNQRQSSTQARNTSVRQNSSQNKENKGSKPPSNNNSKSPFRNKYANVKSRYMDSKSGKSDKTASETTPSETSEVEKRPSTANKRPSKSLASSVHLSPGIRQTARAVSLSKIPVSVRNSSQKRAESDKDTTSGSDNGFRSERTRAQVNGSEALRSNKKLNTSVTGKNNSISSKTNPAVMRKSFSGGAKSYLADGRPKNDSKTNRMARSQSATTKSRSVVNGRTSLDHFVRGNGITSKHNNDSDDFRSKNSSPDTKCPSDPSSKTSLSEEIPRPGIPFRRDGTFCIDEPTILRKHSPNSDQANIV